MAYIWFIFFSWDFLILCGTCGYSIKSHRTRASFSHTYVSSLRFTWRRSCAILASTMWREHTRIPGSSGQNTDITKERKRRTNSFQPSQGWYTTFSIDWEGCLPEPPLEFSPDFLTSNLRAHWIMRAGKGGRCCISSLFYWRQESLGNKLRFYARVCTISSWCGFCHISSTPLKKNPSVFELVVVSIRGTERSNLVFSIQICFTVLTQAYPEVGGLMFKRCDPGNGSHH